MGWTTVVWILSVLMYVYYVQKVEEERREITSLCMDRVCTLFATELATE
jgi:hypothetical protein